jgi:hypothetical protein
MLKTEKQKDKFEKKPDDELARLYLVHHMHHFGSGKDGVKHETHHCLLFEKKKMKGKEFEIIHKVFGDKVYHCLKNKFIGTLYDHAGNSFGVSKKLIEKKETYEIKI